jgi:hypothetical protein
MMEIWGFSHRPHRNVTRQANSTLRLGGNARGIKMTREEYAVIYRAEKAKWARKKKGLPVLAENDPPGLAENDPHRSPVRK